MDEKKHWDAAADDYQRVFEHGLNDYNRALLRFWQERGMIRPGCRVIDIGCGVGKYGVMLAGLGCEVVLTDISGEMLRRAAENMACFRTPWAVREADFGALRVEDPLFAAGFDLAISTMSPAVHDAATVRKISALSRSWCFLARFNSWEQPVRDALLRRVGLEPVQRTDELSADRDAILRAVGEACFEAQTAQVPYCWSDARSPREMADYLCRRYMTEAERESLYDAALAAAGELAGEDGLVRDAVNAAVTWIWWKA